MSKLILGTIRTIGKKKPIIRAFGARSVPQMVPAEPKILSTLKKGS